jgi:hypothetical protein
MRRRAGKQAQPVGFRAYSIEEMGAMHLAARRRRLRSVAHRRLVDVGLEPVETGAMFT